jgi:hypothetical protein
MKAMFVVFAPALESDVHIILEKAGIKKYTKFPHLEGVGGHSEPHLDTHIWPGSNMGLFISTDETTAKKLAVELINLKNEYLDEGLKIFSFNVEELA